MPAPKEPTPVLDTTDLEMVAKHATSTGTYMASFTLAQVGSFNRPFGPWPLLSAGRPEDVRPQPGVRGQPAEAGAGQLRGAVQAAGGRKEGTGRGPRKRPSKPGAWTFSSGPWPPATRRTQRSATCSATPSGSLCPSSRSATTAASCCGAWWTSIAASLSRTTSRLTSWSSWYYIDIILLSIYRVSFLTGAPQNSLSSDTNRDFSN